MGLLTDRTTDLLRRALDAAALRQEAIAHNIANAETPGYKRLTVDFEESLRRALAAQGRPRLNRTHPAHLAGAGGAGEVAPVVRRETETSLQPDGNNVDVDLEMTELAANSINYNAAVQLLNARLGWLRYVISEGRR